MAGCFIGLEGYLNTENNEKENEIRVVYKMNVERG